MKHEHGYRRHQQTHELDKFKEKTYQNALQKAQELAQKIIPDIDIDMAEINAFDEAWLARENAVARNTKVGCAIITDDYHIVTGCNVSHPFNKSIHAEVSAIANMITQYGPDARIRDIIIVAKRDKFTPCGDCCDWIMQFSLEDALVHFSNETTFNAFIIEDINVESYRVRELMPHYPR